MAPQHDQAIDPREADSQYQPFPEFALWKDCVIDTDRWERYRKRVLAVATTDSEVLERAQRIVQRVAAVETGAVEKLYEVDRGFTLTVATQGAMWEAALSERPPDAQALIRGQLEAYDQIIDFVTEAEPLALAWIRDLHATLCKGQKTYVVNTATGPQTHDLPHGRYKTFPNHVIQPDGTLHAYAPVESVGAEMQRFSTELQKDDFREAHSALQAAYAHYVVVAVHPFADGNGRVARALASVFTYRDASIPYLVFAEDRPTYFAALSEADSGAYQPFVDFSVERSFSAIELVEQSMRTAQVQNIEESSRALARLYEAGGGYTFEQVDRAATELLAQLQSELAPFLKELKEQPGVSSATSGIGNANYAVTDESYRLFVNGKGRQLSMALTSKPPAEATVQRTFRLEVPRDCGARDDIRIVDESEEVVFTARVSELADNVGTALTLRLRVFAERIVRELSRDLVKAAAAVAP